jgi:hypothetical protein
VSFNIGREEKLNLVNLRKLLEGGSNSKNSRENINANKILNKNNPNNVSKDSNNILAFQKIGTVPHSNSPSKNLFPKNKLLDTNLPAENQNIINNLLNKNNINEKKYEKSGENQNSEMTDFRVFHKKLNSMNINPGRDNDGEENKNKKLGANKNFLKQCFCLG